MQQNTDSLVDQNPQKAMNYVVASGWPNLNRGGIPQPPVSGSQTTTLQKLRVWGNTGATTSSGAVLWAPCRGGGHEAHRLSGFEPNIPFTSNIHATPATTHSPDFYFNNFVLQLKSYVFCPVSQSLDISVAPDLSQDFSRARIIAGAITIVSDGIANNSNTISGTFSAAALNDTRALNDFSTTVMMTSATTEKDGVSSISVDGGIAMVVGPDWPKELQTINRHNDASSEGSVTAFNVLGQGRTFAPTSITPAISQANAFLITPDLLTPVGVGSTPSVPAVIKMDAIGMYTVPILRVKVDTTLCTETLLNTSGGPPGVVAVVECFHIFIQDGGDLNHILNRIPSVFAQHESFEVPFCSNVSATLTGATAMQKTILIHDFVARKEKHAMYVGSLVFINQLKPDAGQGVTTTANAATIVGCDVIAQNLYQVGELNAIRLCRWDNVGQGGSRPALKG